MRNNGPDYFFDRYFSVGSVNSGLQAAVTKVPAQPSLQFFPEGGNLVNDVKSRVAFKAIAADGTGINVKGIITDNENKEIVKFESAHLGMGVFSIVPEAGKTYKAKIIYANGAQSVVLLPAAMAKGIVLAINNDNPAKVAIEIRANRDYYKENLNKDLNIIIYGGGSVNTVKTKLDNEVLGLDLPAASFRTGVLQVTLLSQTGEPLSERIAFIQNPDLLNLSVTAGKPVYKTNQKVLLNLSAKTRDNIATPGYFSVAVTDENKVPADENAESGILATLLLTSDLKGNVEQPDYYFNNPTPETRNNLDALMLTQGYRRFVWKEILNSAPTPLTYNPEGSFEISGSVKSKTGVPFAGKTVQLLSTDGSSVLNQDTDAQGDFTFPQLAYWDNSKFILKTETTAGKNQAFITIKTTESGLPADKSNATDGHYNPKADVLASLFTNQPQGQVMASTPAYNAVTTDKGAPDEKIAYKSSNLSGSGHADQVIQSDKILTGTSLSIGLNGLLNGVDFANGVPYLKTGVVATGGGIVAQPMLIIVDGTTGSNIDDIEPLSVETVEVLKGANAAIYGVRGASGVLVITTKSPGTKIISKEMAPGIISIVPKGFYKAREFYSPQYDNPSFNKKGQDQRSTIYWNPNIITDKDGNATFSFFNADGKGTYRVVVEGIDDKGNLGRQVFRYKVE